MDETIEKKVIEEGADFSIFSMFLQADIVVKIVIIILILDANGTHSPKDVTEFNFQFQI